MIALLVLPAAGCLDTGGETTRVYGDDPCPLQMSWRQEGVQARLAEAGSVQPPARGLGFDATNTSLPDAVELRSVAWHPTVNGTQIDFQLTVHRHSADVVLLEAIVPEGVEEARPLAEAFVENVTAEGSEAIVDAWLAEAAWTTTRTSPDGGRTNVTAFEHPVERGFPLEELVANLSLERQPVGADLASVTLTDDPWRLWATTAVAVAEPTVANRSVEVKANPFHAIAVELGGEDAEPRPSTDIVNRTFERLDLPDPEPDAWRFADACDGVDVEKPGEDGNEL